MFQQSLITSLSLTLLAPCLGFAQQEENTRLPEEIVIEGERSRLNLHYQVLQAEEDMYGVFNELNDEDDFDIHCEMSAPLGTRLKRQVCQPAYYVDAASEEGAALAREWRGDAGARLTPPGAAVIARKNQQFQEKMKEIVLEHPEFVEAIQRYNNLKSALERRRKGD